MDCCRRTCARACLRVLLTGLPSLLGALPAVEATPVESADLRFVGLPRGEVVAAVFSVQQASGDLILSTALGEVRVSPAFPLPSRVLESVDNLHSQRRLGIAGPQQRLALNAGERIVLVIAGGGAGGQVVGGWQVRPDVLLKPRPPGQEWVAVQLVNSAGQRIVGVTPGAPGVTLAAAGEQWRFLLVGATVPAAGRDPRVADESPGFAVNWIAYRAVPDQ